MSVSTTPTAAPAILAEVRDALAGPFADEIAERVPQVIEVLEQQLSAAPQREQWKPLRGAIAMLGDARARLAPAVAREVAKRFDAKLAPGDDVFGKTARFSLDTLTLVEDDQVREEIAIGNATKRLRDQLGEELFTLTQRLASLMQVESLSDERNPAFPRIFARGLYDAFTAFEPDPSTRLAAFAAFGPLMLDLIRGVYQRANRLLVGRGVLPDFKRTYGVPMHAPTRPAPALAGGAGAASAAIAGPGAAGAASVAGGASPSVAASAPSPLERLFAAAGSRAAADPRAAAPAPGAAAGMVTIQVRPELLAALRTLEARLPAMSAEDLERSGIFPPSEEIHRAKRAMAGTLTPPDAIVADVVAALFDRLFADARLCDAAKAQVGRLQLPVLKAILRDHSFFAEPGHPIRHLIDTIAELGACDPAVLVDDCTPEEWIAASVQNIVDAGEEDPDALVREVERLAGALERHHEASLAADPEVQALREREKRFAGLREASLAIAHRVQAAQASEDSAAFLYECWRDVMVHDYVEMGEASEEWTQDLQLVDDMLWVLVPRAGGEERSRLAAMLPTLIFRMKIAFLRAAIDPLLAVERIERLRTMLDGVVRAPAAVAHAAARTRAAPVPADDYTATLHSSTSSAELGFGRGSWFEFREPDGSARRCRLTWMSPVQGVCVFKDLERNRSFAVGLAELGERRRAQTAMPVDGPGVASASVEAALADVARSLDAQAAILPRKAN
ncbi:MAG TPA: DUF1631 family protein [Usitatibacter sp.]|nr:DUF1631 family protein [Usitatibacter sp.]